MNFTQPPKNRKSRKWKKIVKWGCFGYRDYWGEYDCDSPYEWDCQDCPVCIESEERKAKEYHRTFVGPHLVWDWADLE